MLSHEHCCYHMNIVAIASLDLFYYNTRIACMQGMLPPCTPTYQNDFIAHLKTVVIGDVIRGHITIKQLEVVKLLNQDPHDYDNHTILLVYY